MKKKYKLIVVLGLGVLMFLFLHIAPKIALRTHLFITGHPVIAFKIDIEKQDRYDSESKNIEFYTTTEDAVDRETGNSLSGAFEVTKKGFLYFARYYGV